MSSVGPAETAVSAVVGRNVLLRRVSAQLTQVDVADAMTKAGFRWGHTAVSGVERGARRVTVDELVALADLFGVTPGTLLRPPVIS